MLAVNALENSELMQGNVNVFQEIDMLNNFFAVFGLLIFAVAWTPDKSIGADQAGKIELAAAGDRTCLHCPRGRGAWICYPNRCSAEGKCTVIGSACENGRNCPPLPPC
jgi:hypothetical protein